MEKKILKFQREEHVIFSEEENGSITLFNPQSNGFFALNAAGSILWENLQSWKTIEELTSIILDVFKISEPQASKDIAIFIERLRARRLLLEREDDY